MKKHRPFGKEWEKQMMKLTKKELLERLKNAYIRMQKARIALLT